MFLRLTFKAVGKKYKVHGHTTLWKFQEAPSFRLISTTAPLDTSIGAQAIDQSVIYSRQYKEQGVGHSTPSSRCSMARLPLRLITHTSGWQWLSRTPPSTLPNPTSHRIGSRTVAGRSTCKQWRASLGLREPSASLRCRVTWLVGPSVLRRRLALLTLRARASLRS